MLAIIGKSGQLSQALKELCDSYQQATVSFSRNDIDLLDVNNIVAALQTHSVTAVINASAYTAVDKAETDKQAAFELNDIAVGNLAEASKKLGLHLVHVSTDYVFAGDKGSPYQPDDKIAPNGVYGASKAAGENNLLAKYSENSCVLRTSWVYSKFGNNFVKTMLRLMREKPALGVIDDQIGSPTSATTLAMVCFHASQSKLVGVHHVSDEGVASWYDFAVEIQRQGLLNKVLKNKVPIKPISTSEYPTPAVRPHYSVLSKGSLKKALPDIELPHWQHALELVINELA
jgi:dTDP-4-dehydrorhamnose reductase